MQGESGQSEDNCAKRERETKVCIEDSTRRIKRKIVVSSHSCLWTMGRKAV